MTMHPAVAVRDVSKSFTRKREVGEHRRESERVQVLQGLSFEVEEGEVFCLLGRNGSGKTTLMRIISTLIEPDQGSVRICGFDARTRGVEVRRRIGVMLNAGEGGFQFRLSGPRNLEYYAVLYKIRLSEARARIRRVLHELGLGDRLSDQYQSYSSGMRRRLALARALLPEAPVLLLDEPTLGVDPWSTKQIHGKLRELAGQGKTILCTTNSLVEAQALGGRVCRLENGSLTGPARVELELA